MMFGAQIANLSLNCTFMELKLKTALAKLNSEKS